MNEESSKEIILKLLYLDSISHEDIYFYINSNGGDVTLGLAIVDCMNYIRSHVITICIGKSYSMGAILLLNGYKRYALPNSEILIHEPSTSLSGRASEINNDSKRLQKMRIKLANIISKKTNKSLKKVLKDMEIDYFLDSREALEYGLIDKIINNFPN